MRESSSMSRRLCAVLAAAFFLTLFVAVPARAGQTMTLWIRSDGSTFMPPMVKRFNETHENQIKLELVLPQEIVRKFGTSYAAGEAPDAISLDLIYHPQFTKADLCEDLTEYAKSLPYFEHLSKSHVRLASKDGRIYGLPYAADVSFLFYNKDLFRRAGLDPEKPPSNFAEMRDAAEKISKLEGPEEIFGYWTSLGSGGNQTFTFQPQIWASGGDILNADGSKCMLDSDIVRECLKHYRGLFQSGAMPISCQTDSGANRIPLFAAGRTGITLGGTFNLGTILRDFPDLDFGIAPIPGKDGGYSTFAGGDNLIIPKGSKNIAVAKEFLEWSYSLEGQTLLAQFGGLPPRLDTAAEALKNHDPRYLLSAKILEVGQTPYSDKYLDLFNSNNSPWLLMIQDATFTDGDIDAIVEETVEFIQEALDQD